MPQFSFKMQRTPKDIVDADWQDVDRMEAYERISEHWAEMDKVEDLIGAGLELLAGFYFYRRKPQ